MVTGVRRIALWFAVTVTVVVLLFGYRTSTGATVGGNTVLASPAVPAGTTASAVGTTVTGPSASTRWGPVQVQLTVAGGVITDVTVVESPSGNGKDRQINARALPVLVRETLAAQSTGIDMVSGATVTSEGYLESLQGALDQAGL
ncbi:MAG: hypothetical protein JWP68_3249 [Modestobacter sp.]|nr:hypothetical protein [Modestobacter sp.]